MRIDEKLLEHLLKLAKLELETQEKFKILYDLNRIIEMVQTINRLNLDNVEPFKYTHFQNLTLREDIVNKSLSQEEALRNSKDTTFPFFKVPRVIR